jgi:penicillin-binding protein 1A
MSLARTIGRVVVLLFTCTVVIPVVVAGIVLGSLLFLPLPATLPQAKPISSSQESHVFDSAGNEIATFHAYDQNIPIKAEDIPTVLKQAVVSAEDRSFFKRGGGVDLRGSVRAVVNDLKGGATQGGSTITQQYVKLTYTGGQRTLSRKVHEAILASQLARKVSKDEILYKYLSIIYLGDGAYGAGAAAQSYFHKPVNQLNLSESATLAGLIPAPTRLAPRENLAGAEDKRRTVLQEMLDQHYIDEAAYSDALSQVLVLGTAPLLPGQTGTVVYPPTEDQNKYPYFVDYVKRYLIGKYGADTVFQGGLQVQTTLDPVMQAKADQAVANTLKGTAPDLDMSLVSVEPGSGFVKALVGGRDFYDPSRGQVNLALGGCPAKPTNPKTQIVVAATCWDGSTVTGGGSGRQPGSSFKPFTLAAAFEQGISPETSIPAPVVYTIPNCRPTPNSDCTIHNAADGEGGGSMTVRQATAKSVNTAFAGLQARVGGPSTVAGEAEKLGIHSAWFSPQVQGYGANLTLGVEEVSPLEMASAYSVFANRGLRNAPTPIFKITSPDGKVVEDNSTPHPTQVLPENIADTVNDVLQGPLGPGGTAGGKALDRPAAGKTGTTSDYKDAWFVGYTPDLATAVSLGYDSPKPLKGVKGVGIVFGGTIPAQTWHDYMLQALAGRPPALFNQPVPIAAIQDQLNRDKRGGIDPGDRLPPATTPLGGPYVISGGNPQVTVPRSTTTTIFSASTSTTAPGFPRPP